MSEAKRREILQLLKDYRPWHTPHGGAMPLDETGVIDAAYGPAGLIQTGQAFPRKDRRLLRETYEDLDHALNILKVADHDLWIALHRPYLSDAADASVVAEWRRKAGPIDEAEHGLRELLYRTRGSGKKEAEKDAQVLAELRETARQGSRDAKGAVDLHDLAIRVLSLLLYNVDLHVVFPKRMTSGAEKAIENRNFEAFALYETFRYAEGMSKSSAVKKAAEHTGYTERRVWQIVGVREPA